MQIHVSVRWRELHSEPWVLFCGWDSLQVRHLNSLRCNSCLSSREMPGEKNKHVKRVKSVFFSHIFTLGFDSAIRYSAAMACCTLGRRGMCAGCVVEMGPPAF